MSREATFQANPLPGRDFTGFPAVHTRGAERKYRSHPIGRGAWFFASAPGGPGGGRFDLAPPLGTCYLADTVAVAVRERLGPSYAASGMVPRWAAEEFQVTELDLSAGKKCADVAAADAATFGVTRELSTMDSYGVPQQWAALFESLGFDGIRYPARFSTGYSPDAWAVFGAAGPRSWPTYAVVDGVAASESSGFSVYSPPASAAGLSVSLPPGVT
ncbi:MULTISPECIES: RES domain-containing protein [Cryobacterium]|uniref:RES domain-containing protein n=1 Tax=Cryobacterium breve TaxID=1259258 RepID=A0ABY7NFX4_9MICO|nr:MULTISPECIES: RES domain-containing protein [Cryobacterium]MDY7528691.1 RES domain-containing protein [Cryobacterium sp. 10C2]MDY7555567.1 RES domain-containing protein [Cryobacterium sp. 10C3]MEB0202913.1 RES domain-containing protein [Cryobacterium sp. 5I3]MEB0287106.1 RES domain-containing protein [Cryobacterium sp. 10S3]MEB0291245.1 RES domain-containing protein [Cryobacterium sp. 10C2]